MATRLLPPNEVASRLGISLDDVYAIVNRGHLRIIHVGSKQRIRESAVDAYVDSLERDPWNRHLPPQPMSNRRRNRTRTC